MITSVDSSQSMTGLFGKKQIVKYPQIIPRNVYLQTGRVTDSKETQRVIENFGEPFWIRLKNWFKYKIEDNVGWLSNKK